jgi:hypothetical protein
MCLSIEITISFIILIISLIILVFNSNMIKKYYKLFIIALVFLWVVVLFGIEFNLLNLTPLSYYSETNFLTNFVIFNNFKNYFLIGIVISIISINIMFKKPDLLSFNFLLWFGIYLLSQSSIHVEYLLAINSMLLFAKFLQLLKNYIEIYIRNNSDQRFPNFQSKLVVIVMILFIFWQGLYPVMGTGLPEVDENYEIQNPRTLEYSQSIYSYWEFDGAVAAYELIDIKNSFGITDYATAYIFNGLTGLESYQLYNDADRLPYYNLFTHLNASVLNITALKDYISFMNHNNPSYLKFENRTAYLIFTPRTYFTMYEEVTIQKKFVEPWNTNWTLVKIMESTPGLQKIFANDETYIFKVL